MRSPSDTSDQRWDAIVVGSGMGGLVCAAYLAVSGLRVLVTEQHTIAGGNSHVFRRHRRYQFDVGVHYIGDCGPDGMVTSILRGLGLEDRVRFTEFNPDGFDRIVVPGATLDVPTGWTRYLARLQEALPAEQGLPAFVEICRAVSGIAYDSLSKPESLPDLVRARTSELAWSRCTLADLFEHCSLSPTARAVLAAQSANYGAFPSATAVSTHARMLDHYLRGTYYPVGGGQSIVAGLVEVIEAHGGQLRTGTQVEKILVSAGGVSGVRATDGSIESAPIIISNADYRRTVLELIEPEHLPPSVIDKARAATMSLPMAVTYVALDTQLPQQLGNNLWWHGTCDTEAAYDRWSAGRTGDLPFVLVSCSSGKDSGSSAVCPPGQTILQLMTLCPGDDSRWSSGSALTTARQYRRDPDYAVFKSNLTDSMLCAAEEAIGPFRSHIVHLETATPLTHTRYTLSSGGTPYGLLKWGNSITARPDMRGPISGLHFVGQSTRTGSGIGGVMAGAVLCAGQILDTGLLREVCSGRVLGSPGILPERPPGWDPMTTSRGFGRYTARPQTLHRASEVHPATTMKVAS